MTRKHYILLAKAFAESLDEGRPYCGYSSGIAIAIERICDVLQLDNARFDRSVFIQAITEYQQKGK